MADVTHTFTKTPRHIDMGRGRNSISYWVAITCTQSLAMTGKCIGVWCTPLEVI